MYQQGHHQIFWRKRCYFNHIMMELCYFSLHQWEIKTKGVKKNTLIKFSALDSLWYFGHLSTQIWTLLDCLDAFEHFWTVWTLLDTLDAFGRFWTLWTLLDALDAFGHFWTLLDSLDAFGHFWTLLDSLDAFGHYWDTFGQFGSFWTLLDASLFSWKVLISKKKCGCLCVD